MASGILFSLYKLVLIYNNPRFQTVSDTQGTCLGACWHL